jgi:hypothetical protein
MIDALFDQSAVFNLTTAIRDDLLTPGPLFQRPGGFQIGVQGLLLLRDFAAETTYPAHCTFIASGDWRRLPPKVFCSESWVRHTIEWHVLRDGSLCYEFCGRWADRVADVDHSNQVHEAVQYAAQWCLNGCRSLLEKHLFADRQNIKAWPKKWDAWPHGFDAANYEYHQQLKRAG